MKSLILFFILFITTTLESLSQDFLPPVLPWNGKSMQLITKKNNPWITPAEQSDFRTTPTYDETMQWLAKLCTASELQMIPIGMSANGRAINMVVASSEGRFDPVTLKQSSKPLVLIQAGIHAGEIDGKDAGMMLLRDILYGKKRDLIKNVNILFIPILNVDGHARSSQYNRVNQRGPENMGWRTNARNLNLNRDYTKLDTEEIKAVVEVINQYDPQLYIDLHVTDGADYQYDITYGFIENSTYSPNGSSWLSTLRASVDNHLKDNGHIPGPLLFAVNGRDFKDGNFEFHFSPKYSQAYGDARHLPTILVENHSLKPFKQRVLGTYIFLESILQQLNTEGGVVKSAIKSDQQIMHDSIAVTMKRPATIPTMTLLGVESKLQPSSITGKDYVQWLGKPQTSEVPYIKINNPDRKVKKSKVYYVPATYKDVIHRLQLHGIKMEILKDQKEIELTMYRLSKYSFDQRPSEGHVRVKGTATPEKHKEIFYPGTARIDTNQPLGLLVTLLLEPDSPDSFLQWGFFHEIFERTEYAEAYVMEPFAAKMLAENENLKEEFEAKKKGDENFANNPNAIYSWFYERSPYYDNRFLLYPIGIEY